MSNSNSPGVVSRVKARVSFVTWVPSDAGRINTTDKTGMTVELWVNHPLDERWKQEDRGGDQAIREAQRIMKAKGVEWLGLLGLAIDIDDREDTIINQPRRAVSDLGIENGELSPVSKLVGV